MFVCWTRGHSVKADALGSKCKGALVIDTEVRKRNEELCIGKKKQRNIPVGTKY